MSYNGLSASKIESAVNALNMFHITNDAEAADAGDFLYNLRKEIRNGHVEYEDLYEYVKFRIEQYENKIEQPLVSGKDALRYLMEENSHKLKDMQEIAPMSVISEILNGKRELNKGQIRRLAEKYNVSPALFFD